jgi:hypothetical protein
MYTQPALSDQPLAQEIDPAPDGSLPNRNSFFIQGDQGAAEIMVVSESPPTPKGRTRAARIKG